MKRPGATPHQRGAATLVVVMGLFLVMALLAAYANRSLLFEQRVANSYFRASLSQEAAEAGVEWTLAQLNGTGLDTQCAPISVGGARFADKYLSVDAATRAITPKGNGFLADCTRDSTGWICRCPAPGTRVKPAAVASTTPAPSFGVKLGVKQGATTLLVRPGTMTLKVNGCNISVIDDCYLGLGSASQNAQLQQAIDLLTVTVALVSAVRSPPAAPLIAKGAVTSTGTGLGLHNTDPRSAGLLAVSGKAATGLIDSRMDSLPGTPMGQALLQGDAKLGDPNQPAGAVFRMFMGMTPVQYQQQPALRTVQCSGDCAATLAAAYTAGMRMVWVDGPLQLLSNQTLGSPADPMLVIANGDVAITGPVQFSGMLVARGRLDWTNSSGMPSQVLGMVLVEGDVATDGAVDIVYQQGIADQLRNRMGSFVRVPGGWIDAQ